ncbi:MAG TPA: tetratricopeptide repeat protein [Thermoanaerobaculia bacterium]
MKLGSLVSRVALVAGLALFLAGAAGAQDWRGKARVDGRVITDKGEGIPGAKLTLRMKGAGPEAITTDKKGRWAYLGLANGGWDVDVEAPGYQPYKTTVQLSEINRIPPMDIRLQPSPKAEPTPASAAPKGASPDVIPILQSGNALLEQKKFAEARAEYEKALPLIPAGSTAPVLRAIAQTYYGEKKVDEAISTLKKVVDLDPNDTTAIILLANLQLEKGSVDEGKATLGRLPADSVKEPAVFQNLGIVLLNKKKPEDAWTYFDQAVKIAPTDADGYYYRGLAAYQIKSKKAESRADFEKYLELAPTGDNAADVKEYLKSLK